MKIKKFTANTMPEIMKQIKAELGNDAIILNQKEVKTPGFFGLFQKKRIEVTAALDRKPIQLKQQTKPIIVEKTPVKNQEQPEENNKILAEIKHLQQLLETQSFHSEHEFSPEMENIHQFLLGQEVEKELAIHLTNSVSKQFENGVQTVGNIKKLLNEEIESLLSNLSFQGIKASSQVVQFVGPTGVGKTTTLAKIAAYSMLNYKKKIAFITADTYRIAAIEQLKTYAKILDVPIKVVYTDEEYLEALQQFSHYDQIFVDTAGRNYREEQYINELKHMIHLPNFNVQTFLVLALTAKARDITDIFNQFKPLRVHEVIFTKLDETVSFGSILNICVKNNIGVAYLTNGQDVPDDLLQPNSKLISDLIVSRYNDV